MNLVFISNDCLNFRRRQVYDRRSVDVLDGHGGQADAGEVRARSQGEEQRNLVPFLVHGHQSRR